MFEEYNNKNWSKVTKSKFTSCADHYGDENFTDEELKKIKKILYAAYFPIKKNIIVAKKLLYDHNHYYFLIRKHRDEWFTVYFTIYDDSINTEFNSDNKNNEYYICDQFYSVIDVINHIISDKNININESFDLKNINDWQEITNDHHNEFDMKYHYDEFSDEEYSNILKLFTDIRVERNYTGFKHQISITSNSFFSLNNDDYFSMNITKYQDDWYMVYYYDNINNGEPTYYLCDQFYNMIKCIKHLVSSNISDNINESYSEVTFNDVVNRVLVGFNEMELNQIFGHIKGLGINIYKRSPYALRFIVGTIRFEILKLEDEWFILEQKPNKYYKCDQIYGLLKCLDEVLGNKNK